jgi:acetolactate decarboxylase
VKRYARKLGLILIIIVMAATVGCGAAADETGLGRETIAQVSTIDAILDGVYDGVTSYGDLRKYGDFGLGTFTGLDGEGIFLDGEFYQVKADGKVYPVSDDMATPFAAITWFDTDLTVDISEAMTNAQFTAMLDEILPSENMFYAVKVSGDFSYMKTRSVPGQQKPYPPLVEVTANQPEFEMENVSGTIVGFRCPPYVAGVNVVGYHLHFITDARDAGGHILDFTISNAVVAVDYTSDFYMILPAPDSDFYKSDFGKDRSGELEQAEK